MVPPRTIAQILRERVRREPADATATRAAADLERVQRQAAQAGAGTMGVPSGLVEEPLGQQISRIGTEFVLPFSLPTMFEAGKKAARGNTEGAVKQAGTETVLAMLTAGLGSKIRAGRAAANLGREALENSRLVGRPMNFPEEKAALAQRLRAEAETPLPPAMQNRQLIEGEHSSPYLFGRPEISRAVAGTGAGDFWQGPGFYKSTSTGPVESVSSAYRESTAFVPQLVQMPNGIILDRDALFRVGRDLSPNDYRNDIVTRLLVATEAPYTDPKQVLKAVDLYRRRAATAYAVAQKGGKNKAELRERYRDAINILADEQQRLDMRGVPRIERKIPQDLRQATYSTQFAADPDELFDLQRSVTDQPASERILAALRGMSNPMRPEESLADAVARMERAGMPAYQVNERLVGNKYRGISDKFAGLDRFELMNELNARGIVGNQYLTRFAAENPNLPRTFNYVVQDPSRVRLTDVWAAAPIGLALNAADRQQRKQEPQAKR